MWELSITGLEKKRWEPVVGPSINPVDADGYSIVHTVGGLYLSMNSFQPYGGWLAKHVERLLFPATRARFYFTLMTDEATVTAAQVIEFDTKITDGDGITYDLSAQINIANNWMFQIDNENWTWTDTGINLSPMQAYEPLDFMVEYRIDYGKKNSSVIAVTMDEEQYEVPSELWHISGRNEGWAPSEIVTQLQQCNGANPGGYALLFDEIGYVLDVQE